ncbi:uncharacterized protein [Solanum lycopersicum]|uniref:uncharacterized protein n=1 Tax=Solanum lycopersicum TaxID=4081 RepID=UPI0037490F67
MGKMINNYRGWHEMLSYTFLGYRTTVKTSIGDTPYRLVYGTEAVIHAEVEIQSLRIIQEEELSNDEWVSKRIDQLILIDEKRVVVDEYKGKFMSRWKGPYMVRRVLSGGALVLLYMDGTAWPKSINSDAFKRNYV